MKELILKTPAKINLMLDVAGKRRDGYHLIKTVFQTVSIFDYITITASDCGKIFGISCNKKDIPCDERNIVYKAGKALEKATGKSFMDDVHFAIEKNIPSQAGMGGGSSDAAAVMIGLNSLFELGLTKQQLCEIGASVGADVPFFFEGGTALAEGIGEILTPIKNKFEKIDLVIAKPEKGISTAEAYKAVDNLENPILHPRYEKLVTALQYADINGVASNCRNIFTKAADIFEVNNIIADFAMYGALGAEMTGSGSAVFGIFENEMKARDCLKKMKSSYDFVQVCEAVDCKIEKI